MCTEDNVDVHDIELMQYINVDCSKLKRLLQGQLSSSQRHPHPPPPASLKPPFLFSVPETALKFRALKKPAQLAVINSLEKVRWPRPSFSPRCSRARPRLTPARLSAGFLELGGELPG